MHVLLPMAEGTGHGPDQDYAKPETKEIDDGSTRLIQTRLLFFKTV